MLRKERSQAKKGLATSAAGVFSGINGMFNGAYTIVSGIEKVGTKAVQVAGGIGSVTFGIAYGLNAILGLVTAGRDFFNAFKRAKGRKAVRTLMEIYQARAEALRDQIEPLLAEVEEGRIPNLSDIQRIKAWQQELLEVETMRNALATAKHKQGYKGKLFGGSMGLASAAAGMALLAATIGGVAAAATPVGWIIGGIALLATIGFAVGKTIRRKVRDNNIKRMRKEIAHVSEYIESGRIGGMPAPAYDAQKVETHSALQNLARSSAERGGDIWHRRQFEQPGTDYETKSRLHKWLTKSKSGTLTMQARLEELKTYLAKHDKENARTILIEGLRASLDPTHPESAKMVKKDPHDPHSPERSMRQHTSELLEHYFPGNSAKMIASLLSADETIREDAGKRILSKMKLG